MSLRCSACEVDFDIARMEAADATAYAIPMIASCGIRVFRIRTNEKIAAPTSVNDTLTTYTKSECGSPLLPGSSSAMVAPSAAICASDRSTKMTPRSTTCTPR
jgi:hypothetical protein